MKKYLLFVFFFIFTSSILPQESYSFDQVTVYLENSFLIVKNSSGKVTDSYKFLNPSAHEYDLDDDGISELLIYDSTEVNSLPVYKIFIFNTVDSFYLADSINSGSYEPYETKSEETGNNIIIAGNPDCTKYILGTENVFLPLNCWKYDNGELFLVNDELYEIFISESEGVIEFLDDYFNQNKKDCMNSDMIKSAIASVYLNYMNAGEISIASQIMKNYYFCQDIQQFANELNSIAEPGEN